MQTRKQTSKYQIENHDLTFQLWTEDPWLSTCFCMCLCECVQGACGKVQTLCYCWLASEHSAIYSLHKIMCVFYELLYWKQSCVLTLKPYNFFFFLAVDRFVYHFDIGVRNGVKHDFRDWSYSWRIETLSWSWNPGSALSRPGRTQDTDAGYSSLYLQDCNSPRQRNKYQLSKWSRTHFFQ